jgi:hypothetical protein
MANTVIGGETCIWNTFEANEAADLNRSSSVACIAPSLPLRRHSGLRSGGCQLKRVDVDG